MVMEVARASTGNLPVTAWRESRVVVLGSAGYCWVLPSQPFGALGLGLVGLGLGWARLMLVLVLGLVPVLGGNRRSGGFLLT